MISFTFDKLVFSPPKNPVVTVWQGGNSLRKEGNAKCSENGKNDKNPKKKKKVFLEKHYF